jgi:hypothetical protein
MVRPHGTTLLTIKPLPRRAHAWRCAFSTCM